MFMFHIALALNLLALAAGSALYMFASSRCDCKGSCFAKMVAILVILFSVLSTVCTMNAGLQMWQAAKADGKMGMVCDQSMKTDATPAAPAAEKAAPAKAVKAAKKHA